MSRGDVFTLVLIVLGPIIGLAGTDLVLPAIPVLDTYLDGSLEQSQLVLASFAIGTGLGLVAFGELGSRFSQYRLLLASLALYALTSLLATLVDSISQLIAVRFVQGFAASAAAVFAPGMVRALFDDRGAIRAMGLMGSLESVVPAFAPILGAWLISQYNWSATFYATAVGAMLLLLGWLTTRPPKEQRGDNPELGYFQLLRNPTFCRYAFSQALSLGGLIAFVFGAPTVIVHAMDGSITDFITMQIIGISLFMIFANTTHLISDRIGTEATIVLGSILAVIGAVSMLLYAVISANHEPEVLWFLFAILNVGIGIRGPLGFFMAIYSSKNNDSKATAIVMLSVFLAAAVATAVVAPYISFGLLPLALVTTMICSGSLGILWFIDGLSDDELSR